MRIVVKLFAIIRDRAGMGEFTIELPDRSRVSDGVALITRLNPAIADLVPRAACAVNLEYVSPNTVLHDGDELALIPPVSGG
jgi:molybdopterin converting factor subunit 1